MTFQTQTLLQLIIALLSLKVLFNLSFEDSVRSALAESGELFQQLVDLLKHILCKSIVLVVLQSCITNLSLKVNQHYKFYLSC